MRLSITRKREVTAPKWNSSKVPHSLTHSLCRSSLSTIVSGFFIFRHENNDMDYTNTKCKRPRNVKHFFGMHFWNGGKSDFAANSGIARTRKHSKQFGINWRKRKRHKRTGTLHQNKPWKQLYSSLSRRNVTIQLNSNGWQFPLDGIVCKML